MEVFSRVAGHEAIRRHLAAAVTGRTVSHAYLFEGIAGVGKRTMAREFAKALLCTEPQAPLQACGRCVSCRTFDSGNHPDVTWITRGAKASLGIGEIRDSLVRDIHIQPYQSDYKVYLIEEADAMTTEAQNALLKTLEEPPAYVLIILMAANSRKFLPTVLSRVITLHFQPLPEELIAAQLTTRKGLNPEQASLVASLSRGSLGTALDLVSSETFTALREELTSMLESLHGGRPSDILNHAQLFNRYKDQQETVFSLMQIWFRDLLMLKVTGDPRSVLTKDRLESLQALALDYDVDEILRAFSSVQNIQDAIRQGAQYAFAVDCLLASFL